MLQVISWFTPRSDIFVCDKKNIPTSHVRVHVTLIVFHFDVKFHFILYDLSDDVK
jgi:hypothetical protein